VQRGTAGVELAGGAEKAATASPDALELGAYGGGGNSHGFLRWHAGGGTKGGLPAQAKKGQVRKWKGASVECSRRLRVMAGVQTGIGWSAARRKGGWQ
jgi:hypothetical protein